MPMYSFICLHCKKLFDILAKLDEIILCPHCSSAEVERQLSMFGSYKIKGNNSASVTPKKYGG